MFYWIIKWLFWPFARFYLRLRVSGELPEGGFIIVANHVSWLDSPVLGSACPRPVRFLITRRVYDRAGQTWFYRAMRAIPVRDAGAADPSAIRKALRALREGQIVAIFPEGADLDPAGRRREPRSGAALLAARAGALVVPVAIEGTHAALPKGGGWPRPGRVKVTFGHPFSIDDRGRGKTKGALKESAEEMMRRIAGLMEGGGSA